MRYTRQRHTEALDAQQAKLNDVSLTPSARYLAEVQASGLSFNEFSKRRSVRFSEQLKALTLPAAVEAAYREEAARS